jgi:dipeptidyl aminopeptidase/acylaminoacyl peptidase
MNTDQREQPQPKRPLACRRLAVDFLMAAVAVFFLVFACALYLQVVVLTTPFRDQNVGELAGLIYQDVTLTTADGVSISGWYVPGTQPNGIVLVHGIHANRAYLIPQAQLLAGAGYHLLLIDLRGHGRSGGKLLTFGYGEAEDVRAAVDYLLALPEVEQVGVLGHSLGAAAVIREAAGDPRIKALAIQSSYSSLSDAAEDAFDNFTVFPKQFFAPMIVALAEYRTQVDISQVDSARDLALMPARPVLIIHSLDDNLFPFHHAEKMYEAARDPKQLWAVQGIGHINPMVGHEAEYRERVLRFFADAFAR